jgi:hypothetical protein
VLDGEVSREPLLACVAALLLAAAVMPSLRGHSVADGPAVLGTVVFAIGAIGFVVRWEIASILQSWGVMIQGALLVLVGFRRSDDCGVFRRRRQTRE